MGARSSGGSERETPGTNQQPTTADGSSSGASGSKSVALIPSSAATPGTTISQGVAPSGARQQQTEKPTSANQSTDTTAQISPVDTRIGLDQSAQLRSTLAIGQLIASNRPTAGSRLIANELRQLNKTIKDESVSLRKEVSNLSNNLATTLKRVLDEDRDRERTSSASTGGGLARRPMFGHFATRRFPVFRRPRRPLQAVQRYNPNNNTNGTASPNDDSPLTSAAAMAAAAKTLSTGTQTPEVVTGTTQKQTALKLSSLAAATKSPASISAAKALAMVFKGPWLALDRSYDGEIDSDSNETTPSSSP